MAEYDWLAELCDDSRSYTAHPFALELDGEVVTIATNGRVLLAVSGRFAPAATTDQVERIGKLRGQFPTSMPRAFSLAALRAFVGLPEEPSSPCGTCKGSGRRDCDECEGEGDTECQCSCGDVHSKSCRACGGAGFQWCPDCTTPMIPLGTVPIRLFGVLFDRRVIAPAIARLVAASTTWQNDDPTHAAIIRSETWWLAVMPLREDRTLDYHRNAPKFDGAEALHVRA